MADENARGGGGERFEALDSLRGLSACSVFFYHFITTGIICNLPIFRHAWLFVDFFFVLSGFVIAASYGDRLARGFPTGEFMLLRLGRIYPLHLFMILLYLILETGGFFFGTGGTTLRHPFTDTRTLPQLAANLLLVQCFGLFPTVSWNGPSWSIAAEMWTYLLAALGLAWLGRRFFVIILPAAIVIAPLVILWSGHLTLNLSYSWALARCIFGFALGMLTFQLHSMTRPRLHALQRNSATLLEVAVLTLVVVVLWTVQPGLAEFALPPMFAVVVLVLAVQRGAVSDLLRTPPLRFLGLTSYSIYMVHTFVMNRAVDALTVAGPRLFGHSLTVIRTSPKGYTEKVVTGAGIVPDIITLCILCAVIAFAACTYYLIEAPFRRASRRWAEHLFHRPARGSEAVAPTM